MRVETLVSFFLVNLALSGPVRRGCGQEKCYDAVNTCGMTYGGCWTQCADGIMEIPTFTAPLCDPAVSSDTGYPTQTSYAAPEVPSPTDKDMDGPLITPPPSLNLTTQTTVGASSICTPIWLCVDYLAVCGNSTEMYGACYDTCTSSPPVTSPPCSLSSTINKSSYATSIPTHTPGAAYTEKPASDDIEPAIDDSKALVMAEMPSTDVATSAPGLPGTIAEAVAPDAGEFRIANVQADQPEAEVSTPIEAPESLRGQAIARMKANKDRVPNVGNVPCWDKDTCKEVQLGIPSPVSVVSSTEPTAASTPESSPNTPADAPAEEAPAEASGGPSSV